VTTFAEEFLAMVEALRMAPTFARGRRDARAGHVRSLTISGSLVVAQVRGPEDAVACRARIAVRAFGAAEWSRVEDDLAAEARYVAELLAGRMPADIGTVFDRAGLSLLPLSIGEIAMDCSCERWPMPCVHLAATFYALASSFDEDPFGAFAWRGRPRDELLHRLAQLRGAAAGRERPAERPEPDPFADPGLGDPADFWGSPPSPTPSPASAAAVSPAPSPASAAALSATPSADPVASAPGPGPSGSDAVPLSSWASPAGLGADALLDQLDPPSVPAGGAPLIDVLRPAYRALPTDP
jgi:uncharacterized Zn finger protein